MESNKHLFLPYEESLKLSEKGFDEECFGYYCYDTKKLMIGINMIKSSDIKKYKLGTFSPLIQQTIDWFEKNSYQYINYELNINDGLYKYYGICNIIDNYQFKEIYRTTAKSTKNLALLDVISFLLSK